MKKAVINEFLNWQFEFSGLLFLGISMVDMLHVIQIASASVGFISVCVGLYKKLKEKK